MAKKKPPSLKSDAVVFSSHFEFSAERRTNAAINFVGAKGAGLLDIPAAWTPPYFILSTEFHERLLSNGRLRKAPDLRDIFSGIRKDLAQWLDVITDGGRYAVLFRSSASDETLSERGQYLSTPKDGNLTFSDFCHAVWEIVEHGSNTSSTVRLAVIVQRYLKLDAKGHLSNETHLTPTRDRWVLEYREDHQEVRENTNSRAAKIADEKRSLPSASPGKFRSVMRRVGKWGNEKYDKRMHFEWGLKDDRFWIFQLDFEGEDTVGVDPKLLLNSDRPIFNADAKSKKQFFSLFVPGRRTRWQKLKNINDFDVSNQRPKHRLFFASADKISSVIGDRKKFSELRNEIFDIAGDFGVIRTTTKLAQHNLPRTDTISSLDGAKWLREQCKRLRKRKVSLQDYCFVLHRFIPAIASAWAYCEPDGQVVQIDCLWGLPDGLQFCPHDTFEVDLRVGKVPGRKNRFKPFFLREQLDGSWEYVSVKREMGRHSSLSSKALLYIAENTRQIADKVGEPAQVMWFCDIPPEYGLGDHIPWYRTSNFSNRQQIQKRYGRSFDVQSRQDLAELENLNDHRNLCLRVFPTVDLVRGEDFLDEIIETAMRFELPVEIQGSVLGHAFYKFQNAGVLVYHNEPSRKYDRVRERHKFDKLVRNEIPDQILRGGEEVVEGKLSAEQVGVALAAKLIEELFELINARDRSSQKVELADILEVLRSLTDHYGFKFSEISRAAKVKREKRGGFDKARFLVETSLPKAEQPNFDAQLASQALKSIELGKIRYRKSKTVVPFAALTGKSAQIGVEIGENNPNRRLTVEVTPDGLQFGLVERPTTDAPLAVQLNLFVDDEDEG